MADAGLHLDEVDGVPVYWVDAEGPFTAGLVFGAAVWHEEAVERGLSHVVEHLALHEVGDVPYLHNGQVDMVGTSLFVRGEPDEAAAFFTTATRALASLPLARLPAECRVLTAEANGRGDSVLGILSHLRWGQRGPGLIDFPEYALRTADPEVVDQWRRARFGRNNVALWCSGPPPSTLDLSALPEAEPHRPPLPSPVFAEPCYEVSGPPRFSLMAVIERAVTGPAGVALLQSWLLERVRHRAGSAYAVLADYLPVTADEAIVLCSVDAPPDSTRATFSEIWRALDELRTTSFSASALDLYRERMRRAEAEGKAGWAAASAGGHVLGRADMLDTSWLDRRAALTSEEVTEEVLRWIDEAQWLVPHDARPSLETGLLPARYTWREEPISGRPLRHHSQQPEPYDLHVGTEGLSLVFPGDTVFTVAFDQLAVARRYDDGTRAFYAYDGTRIVYEPDRWGEDPAVGERLDASCGRKLVAMGPLPG